MKTQWTKEQGSGQWPERFERVSSDTYIQRRNITEASESEEVTDPGWECESRFISEDVYEALMEEYDSPTYKTLLEQMEIIEAHNAELMLSQVSIEVAQADQDETLSLILENTTPVNEEVQA